jgi:GR25 family glycosyltransferase involved in LPS biosynthesis
MTRETAPSYQGFYINLDRSVLRDERMQAQLAALGLMDRYTRLPAIDGAVLNRASGIGTGETGAFLSHARALELAQALGLPVHVLEDDALLSEHIAPVIADAIAAGLFENFDILFTDIFVNAHLGMLKGLKAAFDRTAPPLSRPLRLADLQVLDLARENFACMTSYIVGAKSLDRILALYRAELEKGPTKPVDLFLRDCVFEGRLRAGLLFPFITSFRLDEIAGSTIAEGSQIASPSVMVLAVLRYLFFVGRDLGYAKACLDAATKQNRRETDPHNAMMAQALEFVLSADFQQF